MVHPVAKLRTQAHSARVVFQGMGVTGTEVLGSLNSRHYFFLGSGQVLFSPDRIEHFLPVLVVYRSTKYDRGSRLRHCALSDEKMSPIAGTWPTGCRSIQPA